MTTKIERAISIGVSSDTTEARRDLAKVEAALRAVKDPTVALQKSMALLNDMVKQESISQQQAALAMMHLGQQSQKQIDKNRKLAESYDHLSLSRAKAMGPDRSVFDAEQRRLRQEQKQKEALDREIEKDKRQEQWEKFREGRQARAEKNLDALEASALAGREARERREAQLAERRRQRRDLETAKAMGPDRSVFDAEQDRRTAMAMGPSNAAIEAERRARQGLADMEKEYAKSRAKTLQGEEYMLQFENRRERMNRQLREANGLYMQGALSAHQFAKAKAEIAKSGSLANNVLSQTKGVVGTLLGPLTIAITAFEAMRFTLNKTVETDLAKAKFGALTGSKLQADKLMADIRNLTSTMPISFGASQKTVTTALQYGASPDEALESLGQLAAITGGDAERMERLGLAFNQARGAGRLMGQELLQMINSGFNPLMVISKETGESMTALKKRMEDANLPFYELADAFRLASSEGGKFSGVPDAVANTTAGKISKLKNEVEKLAIAMGDLSAKPTKAVVEAMGTAAGSVSWALSDKMSGSPIQQFLKNSKGVEDTYLTLSNVNWLQTLLGGPDETMTDKIAINRMARDLINSGGTSLQRNPGDSMTNRVFAQYDMVMEEQRKFKAMSDGEFRKRKASIGGSEEDKLSQEIRLFGDAGQGHYSNEGIAQIEAMKRRLQELKKYKADSLKIEEAFKSGRKTLFGDRDKNAYGNRTGIVDTMREASPNLGSAIEAGVPYEKLLAMADERVRKEAMALDKILQQNEAFEKQVELDKKAKREKEAKAEKAKEELASLQIQVNYKNGLVRLGRDQAEINRIAAEMEISKVQAGQMWRLKKSLESDSSGVGPSAPSAPSAMNFNSAEMFSAMANAQANRVSEQIRLQRRQLDMATAQVAASNRTNEILAEMESV